MWRKLDRENTEAIRQSMNRTTRHITCSHSCPLQRTVKWNSNTIEKNTYKSKLGLVTNLNSKKLCEMDLFNSALKTCKRTKVNSVWKWVSARSYTLTEKNLHAHCECFDAYTRRMAVVYRSVVSTGVARNLRVSASEMAYIVSGGALNSTHSLT